MAFITNVVGRGEFQSRQLVPDVSDDSPFLGFRLTEFPGGDSVIFQRGRLVFCRPCRIGGWHRRLCSQVRFDVVEANRKGLERIARTVPFDDEPTASRLFGFIDYTSEWQRALADVAVDRL